MSNRSEYRSRQLLFAVFHVLLLAQIVEAEKENKRFKCNNRTNIDLAKFCDGRRHCRDAKDEKPHLGQSVPTDKWQSCDNPLNSYNGSCSVQRKLICSTEVECSNITPCDLQCDSHYRCKKSGCASRATVCNGNPCDGCPESHDWKNGVGFKCLRLGRECILPQQLVRDNIRDCDDGTDICFEPKNQQNINRTVGDGTRQRRKANSRLLHRNCFRCLDGMIIRKSGVCDGVIDCPDLSDECLCGGNNSEICDRVIQFNQQGSEKDEDKIIRSGSASSLSLSLRPDAECKVGHVRCGDGSCIQRSSVCDGIKDCDDDEKYDYCRGTINCRDATQYEEVCRCEVTKGVCRTHYGTSCNGVAECDILSQREREVFSKGKPNSFPEDECRASCGNDSFACIPETFNGTETSVGLFSCRLPPPDFRNGTWIRDFKATVDSYQLCDGVENCFMGDDEENCTQRFKCDAMKQGYVSVGIDQTCDGFVDCWGGEDEGTTLCNRTRFRCRSLGNQMVNIANNLVCDLRITCEEGEDEKNCSNDGRFYCESGKPLFVTERQKFDGRGDCLDWSDECPIENPVKTDGFSSRYEMIANPVLRALVWIMGLLSICGNATVLYMVAKDMKTEKLSSLAFSNKMLVMNLAVSDILMGIYLIALGIASVTMQGQYCTMDLTWRSSSTCSTLGVLTVLSSETSVMTLVLMTAGRLYSVAKPFKAASASLIQVFGGLIVLSWAVSLTLALVPLARNLSGTFVLNAQLGHVQFLKNRETSLDEAREFFTALLVYDLKANATVPEGLVADKLNWIEMELLAGELFAHTRFFIDRFFGYYSVDSVCLPKFFITKSDRAWGFSFFVNLFNFLSFTFVAVGYSVIYTQAQNRANKSSRSNVAKVKGTSDLQAKILRLVITDFCCWVPICIMAFAKLGGADLSNTSYVFAAIVLLPINSALNPILYSDLPDVLYMKLRGCFKRPGASPSGADTSGHVASQPGSAATPSTVANHRQPARERAEQSAP